MTHALFVPTRGPRLAQRITRLIGGLLVIGLGLGLMLQSRLGAAPWDVLHQGLARQLGLTVGTWSIITSLVVLVAWLPLREPYGIGTILDAVMVGVAIDLSILLMPAPELMAARVVMLSTGLLAIGLGSGLYLSANLGPGARDGLMTGISRRGPSMRATRMALDLSVLVIGAVLGGTFGVGTVAFALGIGPLVHFFWHRFRRVEAAA